MPKQNISPAAYPQAVLQEIERLAQNIVVARKRRGETQLQWARKLGVSQPTMARIERGDPSVAMASYVMCLWLINQTVGLADLVAPANDHAALEREVSKVRQKLRSQTPARPQKTSVDLPNEVKLGSAQQIPKVQKSTRTAAANPVNVREALANATGLSELERAAYDPMADIRKSLENATGLSELERAAYGPMADIQKALLGNVGKKNPTAEGLASLLLKSKKTAP